MSDLRAKVLEWIDGESVKIPDYAYSKALAALRGEVEAHSTNSRGLCGTCSQDGYDVPQPCHTIERIAAALGIGE